MLYTTARPGMENGCNFSPGPEPAVDYPEPGGLALWPATVGAEPARRAAVAGSAMLIQRDSPAATMKL